MADEFGEVLGPMANVDTEYDFLFECALANPNVRNWALTSDAATRNIGRAECQELLGINSRDITDVEAAAVRGAISMIRMDTLG